MRTFIISLFLLFSFALTAITPQMVVHTHEITSDDHGHDHHHPVDDTVIIRPGKVTDKPKDIFDLPRIELKNLVRGVAWRDEHFKGTTIRQIAEREKLSEGFVGRLIHYSLEFC